MAHALNLMIALLLLATCWMPPLAWGLPGPQSDTPEEAQIEGTVEEEPVALEEDAGESEPAELMTDAERVIRIEGIVELDEQKLADLRNELAAYEELFAQVADSILKADASVEALDAALEAPADEADAQERSKLEDSRSRVETVSDLLRRFSDLVFTAETSTRQQIASLEKKLERERRTLDGLRGLAPPPESARPRAAAAAPAPPVAAEPSGAPLPGIPGVSLPTQPATPPVPDTKLKTADQLEALRALERADNDVFEAEKAVEEFVKRKESLETQVSLEKTLLETAIESAELLREAHDRFRQEVSADELAEIVSNDLRIDPATIRRVEMMIDDTETEIERRSLYLDSLERRLVALGDEELRVVNEVELEREEARRARGRLLWLESPLHPKNLLRWFTERGPRVVLVIAVSGLLLFLLRVAARRTARAVIGTGRGTRAGRENRADTIGLSIQSVGTLVILVGGSLLVFQEAGVDLKTVLGGAAIVGVALAFGAQNMMRDYFAGFMILLEDQYGLGDLVTISGVTGTVETVNMRTTVLRDLEGRVHFIPNGDVKLVTNRTYEWGRAVIEIPISYRENVDRAMEILIDVCKQMRLDPEWGEYLTDDPGMLGVDRFTEYGVVIKFMQETRPDKLFPVRRELLRRVKNRFDEEGIEIPVPQRMVHYPKQEGKD